MFEYFQETLIWRNNVLFEVRQWHLEFVAKRLLVLIHYYFTKIVDMASSDKVVDYNPQITLQKVPTDQYPANEEVFQLKYIPPIPIDQVKAG